MTRVLALCGGVGGAKLAAGLCEAVVGNELMVAINTGDDFEHFGLLVCPDIDSTLYTLAGLNDPIRGWGRKDETWNFMAAVEALGSAAWFRLGDRDLATHVIRSQRLREGASLTEITRELAAALGVDCRVVPMSDQRVSTLVHTDKGQLPFQDYFVRLACRPHVSGVEYSGAADARSAPGLLDALAAPGLDCVVICPSNPWLSIGPILAIEDLAQALQVCRAPVIAVSPIVAGQAIKGPAADMMRAFGIPANSIEIARHYRDLIDVLVIDEQDRRAESAIRDLGLEVVSAPTVMTDRDSRRHLADVVMRAADDLRKQPFFSIRKSRQPVDNRRLIPCDPTVEQRRAS